MLDDHFLGHLFFDLDNTDAWINPVAFQTYMDTLSSSVSCWIFCKALAPLPEATLGSLLPDRVPSSRASFVPASRAPSSRAPSPFNSSVIVISDSDSDNFPATVSAASIRLRKGSLAGVRINGRRPAERPLEEEPALDTASEQVVEPPQISVEFQDMSCDNGDNTQDEASMDPNFGSFTVPATTGNNEHEDLANGFYDSVGGLGSSIFGWDDTIPANYDSTLMFSPYLMNRTGYLDDPTFTSSTYPAYDTCIVGTSRDVPGFPEDFNAQFSQAADDDLGNLPTLPMPPSLPLPSELSVIQQIPRHELRRRRGRGQRISNY
ncbi:hypothetical protein B0H14DRAFT_3651026 [Mycena olivaceomarginata]|nr:hypothetical protein B0H14DRAFT_3651026 [Mycena olivaceomarginata]